MTTQLTTAHLTASGSAYGQPTRVRSINYVAGASAGTIVLRDGGASGTILATIDTPASVTVAQFLKLPEMGIKFNINCYCALTNVTGVTLFFG